MFSVHLIVNKRTKRSIDVLCTVSFYFMCICVCIDFNHSFSTMKYNNRLLVRAFTYICILLMYTTHTYHESAYYLFQHVCAWKLGYGVETLWLHIFFVFGIFIWRILETATVFYPTSNYSMYGTYQTHILIHKHIPTYIYKDKRMCFRKPAHMMVTLKFIHV